MPVYYRNRIWEKNKKDWSRIQRVLYLHQDSIWEHPFVIDQFAIYVQCWDKIKWFHEGNSVDERNIWTNEQFFCSQCLVTFFFSFFMCITLENVSAANKMDGKMSGKVTEADRDKTVTEPNMDRSDISLPQCPSQPLLTTKRPAVFLTVPQRILCPSRFKDNFEMRSAVRVWLVMRTPDSPSVVKLKTDLCKAFHLCLPFFLLFTVCLSNSWAHPCTSLS